MDIEARRRKQLIAILAIIFLLLVGVVIVIAYIQAVNDKNKPNAVYIANLSACSPGMQKSIEDSLRTNMYDSIKAANDYNKKDTLKNYSASIREGSCKEETQEITEFGATTNLKITTAILDIPDAQQSWGITYNWLPNGKEVRVDLGDVITPYCLEEKDLIYGTFNCEKVLSLVEHGTDKVDPILSYVPYSGSGFTIDYDPETKVVTATIQLRASEQDNQELITNLKKEVEYWFSSRNLTMSSYTVNYTYEIISSRLKL